MLHDFKGLVRPESIADEYPWILISLYFSLGIKHSFNSL